MQAFSHFWMPDFMHSPSHEKMACTKPHPTPVVNVPMFNNLKRKRKGSWSTPSPVVDAPFKRQKRDSSRQPSATPDGVTKSKLPQADVKELARTVSGNETLSSMAINSSDVPRRDSSDPNMTLDTSLTTQQRARLMRVVQRQLDLEILYKNDELRFIEQEIAKCQIAMEQLRRCRVIPFPGQPGSQFSARDTGDGIGPALEPPIGLSRPDHPAPYGVTDGPYTRHYARWLLPDSAFDATVPQPTRQHTGRQSVSGRSTRSVATDQTGASRVQRGSTVSSLQALPPNYPAPKDRNAPLIAIRPSDRKPVRLVCKKCGKDNISSMQGFLNHCRIQHKHEYTSHGQAAEDCGILLEEGEIPAVTGPSSELPTPVSAVAPSSNRPLVHPLNIADPHVFAARVPAVAANSEKQSAVQFSLPVQNRPDVVMMDTHAPAPQVKAHSSFVASPLAPRLSSLLQKRGLGLNLKSLVESAKDRSDFENICEHLPSDDEKEESKPSKPRVIAKPKTRRGTSQSGPRPPPLKLQTQTTMTSGQRRNNSETMPPAVGVRMPAGSHPLVFNDQTNSPDMMSVEPSPETSSFSRPHEQSVLVSPFLPIIEHDSSSPTASSHRSPHSHITTNTDASPHTVDTNPGLITDNDDGESDDEDAASEAASDGGVDVGVVEHEVPDVKVRGQGHDDDRDHHASGVAKTGDEGLGIRGADGKGFRGLNKGSNTSRRGRPGKGGKGKGGKKRG